MINMLKLPLQNLVIIGILSSDGVHTQTHGGPGSCITTIFKVKLSGESVCNNVALFLHESHMIESEPVNS